MKFHENRLELEPVSILRTEIKPGITLIKGPMGSGKTGKLIEILKNQRNFLAYRSDTQSEKDSLFKRFGLPDAIILDLKNRSEKCDVIGIDEAHLWNQHNPNWGFLIKSGFSGLPAMTRIACILAYFMKFRVIVSGLALNWKGQPFEPTQSLAMFADEIISLTADCSHDGCMIPATHNDFNPETETYTAVCFRHFEVCTKLDYEDFWAKMR